MRTNHMLTLTLEYCLYIQNFDTKATVRYADLFSFCTPSKGSANRGRTQGALEPSLFETFSSF